MQFKYKKTALIFVAVFLLMTDRMLKAMAFKLQPEQPLDLLGSYLQFEFVQNYYISLSIPVGGLFVIILSILIVLGLIAWFVHSWSLNKPILLMALSLVILGAASNIYDRIIYGYVIDYFSFKYLFTNNMADMMIFIGVIELIFKESFQSKASKIFYISQ
jgi:signal peptidase II